MMSNLGLVKERMLGRDAGWELLGSLPMLDRTVEAGLLDGEGFSHCDSLMFLNTSRDALSGPMMSF